MHINQYQCNHKCRYQRSKTQRSLRLALKYGMKIRYVTPQPENGNEAIIIGINNQYSSSIMAIFGIWRKWLAAKCQCQWLMAIYRNEIFNITIGLSAKACRRRQYWQRNERKQ